MHVQQAVKDTDCAGLKDSVDGPELFVQIDRLVQYFRVQFAVNIRMLEDFATAFVG